MEDLSLFLGASAVQLISDTFGELRHFDSAFDTSEEASDLLRTILPSSTSEDFLHQASESLMTWKAAHSSLVKRQRRLHLERVSQTLLVTGEPVPTKAAHDFENIIRNDPKVFLEMAKRSQKRRVESALPGSRAEKEDKERRRYALELGTILEEACLPVSLQIVELEKPETAWIRIWGSRRSKTLRNRFRAWSRFRAWMIATYGLVWPKNVTQVINFVEELIDFGCPISFPGEFVAALTLLEQVGKVLESNRISSDPLLGEHLKSWKMTLVNNSGGRGPARPYTTAILIALELFTNNSEIDVYFRFVSWLMLLAHWASLRVDDIQNIQPETVRLSTRGLSFRLSRTKTSGPGRLHGAIHGFVARDISITGEDWMTSGILALQRDDMKFPRDYLIPGPAKSYSGFIPKVVEPPELANYFRMVLSRLPTPRFHDGKWISNEQLCLVPETTNLFWTGHSARHFATQAAAAIGIGKERRDYLGRWAIGRVGSDAYLHTSRQVVEKVQQEILASLHAEGGYNEDELLDDFKEFAEKQGLVGFRVRRRHKVLPLSKLEPCLMLAEDSDDSLADEDVCQRRLVAEGPPVLEPQVDSSGNIPQYYITISRRNGFRRLHMSGACPVQAWKCQGMEEVQDIKQAAFDAVCLNCKRKIQSQENAEEADEDSDSVGDSSSTDSDIPEMEDAI